MSQNRNQRWSTPGAANLVAGLVFASSLVFFASYMQVKGVWTSPPAPGGDAVDYAQIASNMAEGKGFTRDGVTPCVDRPPLYPWLLSLTLRGGQRFDLIRWGQAVILAFVAGSIARTLFRRIGAEPVALIPLLLIADPRIRTMGSEILTEALACGLTTALWVLLSRDQWHPRQRILAAAGIMLGLLILCRTMMVIWLPVLCVMVWMRRPASDSMTPVPLEDGAGVRTRRAAILVLTALLIVVPWVYRNVSALGEFRPLGTQGEEQLAAAWSDEAFTRRGMWFNLDEFRFFEGISNDSSKPLAIRRADLSKDAAKEWVLKHPIKALLLPPMRVFQEIRPHGPGDLFVLSFAVLGLVIVWVTPEGRAARAIILAQTAAIAMTWSVAGRFLYPLLGIMHYLAAVGLWGAYVTLIRNRQQARNTLFEHPLREASHSSDVPPINH